MAVPRIVRFSACGGSITRVPWPSGTSTGTDVALCTKPNWPMRKPCDPTCVVTPFVRIETPTHLIQLASRRPFEDAVKQAFLWLLDWLVESYDVAPRKAVTHFNGNPQVQVRVYCTSLGEKTKGSVGVCFPKSAIESSRT